jgi:preprotein translocase subunit SecG
MHIALTLILIVQILSALTMVGLILMQHGKGADMGASFGSGSSGSLFGATGSANFLSRSTAVAATLFFVCTLALAYFGNRAGEGGGLMGKLAGTETPVAALTASAAVKPASAVPAGIAQIPGAGPAANVAPAGKAAVIPATKASGSK